MRRYATPAALGAATLALLLAGPVGAEPPAGEEAIAEAPAPSGAPDPLEAPADDVAAPEAPAEPEQDQRARDNAEVIRLAEEREGPDGVHGDLPSLGGALLKMVVVLGGVSLLAYLLLGRVLPRVLRVPTATGGQRIMKVVDRLPLDQRRSILVIAVGEEHFMVGASEGGIHLISRLDADQLPVDADPPASSSGGLSRFAEALVGHRSKEG